MTSVTVLIIDDEPQIRRALRNALTAGIATDSGTGTDVLDVSGIVSSRGKAAVRILEAAIGRQGIDLAASESPGLIVLDLGLPDMSGLQVCREIRQWSTAPIIVLSARHGDAEKVALLDAGADDYLTKPFSTMEFMARVRAQLRRVAVTAPNEDIISVGELTVE